MGLGKTLQAIQAADQIGAIKILVICPAIACVNWQREFVKFSKFKRNISIDEIWGDVVIVSYDKATLYTDFYCQDWDLVILDEVHFLKSVGAKRAQAVYGSIIRRAKRVWALSGTPMPSHAGELWTFLHTFGRYKGSYNQYVEEFCTYYVARYGGRDRLQITGTKVSAIPALRELLAPIMLRRNVLKDLPPINFEDLVIEPGDPRIEDQGSFIEYFYPVNRALDLMEKLADEEELLERLIKQSGFKTETWKILEGLATSVSTLRRYTGLQKVRPIGKMISDEMKAKAYKKLVVFAIHRDVIVGLRNFLRDRCNIKAVTLFGKTDPKMKQKHIDWFQDPDSRVKVFIANIQAAGTAISLTAAHHVIMLEQSWVPGDNAQAVMRVHRIGQENPVFVRSVGLADSIDEHISQRVRQKSAQLVKIFDGERRKILEELKSRGNPKNTS